MKPRDNPESLWFDAFRLDGARGVLLDAGGTERSLRPKAFALLRHFLENPGRLLDREHLLNVLWPGIVVTDDSLTQCVSDLRCAFGQRAPYVLRTVPKRGYTLIAEVSRNAAVPTTDAIPDPSPTPAPAARDLVALRRETMVVERFQTPDGDRLCVVLADGLASDLVGALTCLEGLRVVPNTATGPREGFSVGGEVRVVGDELRTTLRLAEAATGIALWAVRFSHRRDGLPELSAAELATLVVHLGQQVDRHCLAVARQKVIGVLSARELHLIGRDHHQRGTEADTTLAREMFELAMAEDPDYAHAFAWQAYTVCRAITHGWGGPGGQAARDETLRLARRAVQIDPTSPLCLSRLAFALMLHQRWDDAVQAARAAVQSDRPAFTAARDPCCDVLTQAGYPEEAAAIARGTLVLDPLCSPITQAHLGRALLLAGQTEDAIQALRWCASRLPDYAPAFDSLVVAALESGRAPEAAAAWKEVCRLMPGWAPENHTGLWCFRHADDLGRFRAAYHRAAALAGATTAEPPPSATTGQADAGRQTLPSVRAAGRDVAALRRETLVLQHLRTAADDVTAARAASSLMAALTDELVRFEQLRIVAGPGSQLAGGFAISGAAYASGGSILAHLQLDDLCPGTTIWTGKAETTAEDARCFAPRDISALAAVIDLQIGRHCLRRARETAEAERSARDLTLLGREHYHRSTEGETAAAQRLFARAALLDAWYAPAFAGQAFAMARVVMNDWQGPSRPELIGQAVQLARHAVELEPESPIALASLSVTLALGKHWEEAVATARLALETSRVGSHGTWTAAGDVLAAAGHADEAEAALRFIIDRDPHCSPFVRVVLGRALLQAGRPGEAMIELRRGAAQLPHYALCFRTMVVAAIEAGLDDEARDAFRQMARIRPDWTQVGAPIFWFLRNLADRDRYARALDKAMRLDGGSITEDRAAGT